MQDDVIDRTETQTNGDRSTVAELPVEEMLHGVAAQSATMVSLRELMIEKGIFTQDEWNEKFHTLYASETERYRSILSAQRVT